MPNNGPLGSPDAVRTIIEPAKWTAGTIAERLKAAVLINREIVERAAGVSGPKRSPLCSPALRKQV